MDIQTPKNAPLGKPSSMPDFCPSGRDFTAGRPAAARREPRRPGALPTVVVFAALLTLAACARAAEPQRLTADGRLKLAPVFLGSGEEIAFSVHDVPNRVTLMRLRLAD